MTSLRNIHTYMTEHKRVLLRDGRTGKIVRVDTTFPSNDTTVTIWTDSDKLPAVTKVRLDQVVGVAPIATKSA
jgi:hypothetical protein